MDKYAHLSREELIRRLEAAEQADGKPAYGSVPASPSESGPGIRKVMADVLMLLLNAGAEEAIDRALGKVMDFFDADRAYIHLYDWELNEMDLAYEVTRDRLFTLKENLQHNTPADFPWWFDRIVHGRDLVIPSVDDLPEEAARERGVLQLQAIRSLMSVPLFSAGKVVASLGIEAVRRLRDWTELEREHLHMLGDLIAIGMERRQAEESLKESERLLRTSEENYRQKAEQAEDLLTKLKFVVGTGDSLMWEYDVPSERLEVQLELVGDAVSPGHVSSLRLVPFGSKADFYNAIYPADRKRVFEDHFERLLRGEIDHYAVSYRRWSQKGYIWVYASVHTYKWTDEGLPLKVVYYLTNVHEQIARQKKIDSLNAMMQVILNNVPVVVMVKDIRDDFRYVYFNQAAERFTGLRSADCLGKTDADIYADAAFARSVRELDRLAVGNGEYSCYAADCEPQPGNKRIINSVRVVIDDESDEVSERPLLITLIWDITERREKEIALIKAQESDKLKSAFLANMSHEIRTPLNAIVGFSSILAETEDPAEKLEFVEIIRKNNELLLQLVNDILDFSKIESGRLDYVFGYVDLKNICREACRVHAGRLNPGVRLVFDAEEHAPLHLYTGERRVTQVISNFLTNAAKFTTEGSITLTYRELGHDIYVAVTDTGIGIPAGQRENVFRRFVKLNTFKQGTGLGLTICKMMIDGLGGTIGVDSEPGRGSTFWFTLPWKTNDTQKTPEQAGRTEKTEEATPEKEKKPAAGKKSMLVAEDVEENYQLVEALFGKRYRLFHACNGEEAVKLFRERHPDLILMDLKMPVKDGFEATREIREESATVPIVALSAFAFESEKKKAHTCGFSAYLVKPVDIPLMKRMVADYLEK